jgi:hypothetical protein
LALSALNRGLMRRHRHLPVTKPEPARIYHTGRRLACFKAGFGRGTEVGHHFRMSELGQRRRSTHVRNGPGSPAMPDPACWRGSAERRHNPRCASPANIGATRAALFGQRKTSGLSMAWESAHHRTRQDSRQSLSHPPSICVRKPQNPAALRPFGSRHCKRRKVV